MRHVQMLIGCFLKLVRLLVFVLECLVCRSIVCLHGWNTFVTRKQLAALHFTLKYSFLLRHLEN